MRKIFVYVVAAACAIAANSAGAFDSYRAGATVIHVNDAVQRLEEAMGQPERVEPIENKYGAHTGEYYYYTDGPKTVRFFISGGLIVQITEIR